VAGLGSILKLMQGGTGPEQMQKMLKIAGIDIAFSQVPATAAAFTELGQAASLPGSELLRLTGKTKDGKRIEALMVVAPALRG
jgi:hypothetical protein